MTVVTQGEVPVFPTFKGFRQAVVSEVDTSTDVASKTFGQRFSSGVVSAVKGAGIAVGATFLAAAGTAAVGVGAIFRQGIDRSLNLQDAEKQLEGLGHSAESVEKIMGNALASVKGTAFGLDSAATVAASAVAAGIKPGQELERTLSLTADAATIANISMDEMGSIMNKVASSGKLTTDVVNQFSQRGVPLLQMVADQYGVTAEAASEMVSKGEVDFATFQSALEQGVGGAALSSGDTARGAFANIQAAFGRLGAMFLTGGVAAAPTLFQSISAAVDRAAEALEPYAEKLNGMIGPAMERLAGWIDTIDFGVVVDKVAGFVSGISGLFQGGGLDGIGAGFSAAFASIGDSLTTLAPAFTAFRDQLPAIGGAMAQLAASGLEVVTVALGFLADNIDVIIDWMPAIVAGFVAWRVASAATAAWTMKIRAAELAAAPVYFANNVMRLKSASIERSLAASKAASTTATTANTTAERTNTAAKSGGLIATARATAAKVAERVATVASTVATKAAAVAQRLFNAAMSANPIMLIVTAVAALVAGLIWFFTQTELGQEIWANFTQFLGEAWANVSAWFMAVGEGIATWWNGLWSGISNWFTSVWEGIVAFAQAYVAAVQLVITTVINTVRDTWNNIWNGISTFFSNIWSAIVDAAKSYVGAVRDNFTRVIDFISGIPDKVMGFFSNIGTWLKDSGMALVNGFLDGIKGAWNTVVGWVEDGLGAIRDLFPFSPAKTGPFSGRGWVVYSGRSIGESFGVGVTGSLHSARDDIRGELGGISDEFDQFARRGFDVESTLRAVPSSDGSPWTSGSAPVAGVQQVFNLPPGMTASDVTEYAGQRIAMELRR